MSSDAMLLPADGVSRERVVSLRVLVAVSWLLADFSIHSELATFAKYGLLAYVSLLRAPTFFGAPNS